MFYRIAVAFFQICLICMAMFSCTGEKNNGKQTVCNPECGNDETCVQGVCVPVPCEPACPVTEHCVNRECVENICTPPCQAGYGCLLHGGSECICLDPPCDNEVITECNDGLDNDGDGWVDEQDPDCMSGDQETGFGTGTCNDGIDNDGNGMTDSLDPSCITAWHDEVLGDGPCADVCLFGAVQGDLSCRLWNAVTRQWEEGLDLSTGRLHNRSRAFTVWLRNRLMPVGGIMRGLFSDNTFEQIVMYGGTRDSPIWTGIYLAAESMRAMVTGSPDAREQVAQLVRTMNRWWRISGDRGYLARYAAPASSPSEVLAIFDPSNPENHRNVMFQGELWHWKGNISRDQYQGVLVGYAFAYEATHDEGIRAIIRADVVDFVEQLITRERRAVRVVVDGVPMTVQMDLQHVVYTDDETPDGIPRLTIRTSPFEFDSAGFLQFWPKPSPYLRQIPGLGWLPEIVLNSQAIQLASMILVALHVTEGVPEYADRRAAILQHYEENVVEWYNIARDWKNTNDCGDSYHGLNIAFLPAWNWVRLETDPFRRSHLEANVLEAAMWGEVFDHKNVFFAFIYASQMSTLPESVLNFHLDQFMQFPAPPSVAYPVDNTGNYPENTDCPGLSSIAIDVRDRVPATFMWERNPWKLSDPGTPNLLYSGVDYLVTYWMARYYGFLEDDSADVCLRWSGY